MTELKTPEIFEGKVLFIESARLSQMGKTVLKFTFETSEKRFRCTTFGDTAKIFDDTVEIGDQLTVQGLWNEYRGEQSLNVQFFRKPGAKKRASKKGAPRQESEGDLQAEAVHRERMVERGWVRGWQWSDETKAAKQYRWVRKEDTRGENQIRLDYICEKLGYQRVAQEIRAFLLLSDIRFKAGKLDFPCVEYNAKLNLLELEANGEESCSYDGWNEYEAQSPMA